ncbi:Methyltransferase domain-containing protein [Desulfacinum hydrothermale DSM 13146]|uniref:Methyltransferase domain-containing protein n=1 Tax=Desulfacinum hydrothermale DSM 13146 TaxID=1121390 RepID=A0A1W1WZE3_9BACT|nr:class I SAM-dependent methyltransferase [Desulfacinum hydrothermale]SMC16973.1 Methyltransferase domain-containing protein [Desulfacinum hydrothermale DSM 13146]
MGYVFRLEDALRMERWAQSEPGRTALRLERLLLERVWAPVGPQRVLEVGCGTGFFLRWFSQRGHAVTGLEPSWELVLEAQRRLPDRISVRHGFAEDLPFSDNEFDTVALITTLEFVDKPQAALAEACRVARKHVLLGVLNKWSLSGLYRRLEFLWKPSLFRKASFYSVPQLRRMAGSILHGPPPCVWRTCFLLPLSTLAHTAFLESAPWLQVHPFGHFIAMRIDLRPLTRPLQEPLMDKVMNPGRPHAQISCWRKPSPPPTMGQGAGWNAL